MRLPVAAALSILLAPMLDASRPLEWKAINYAPRGHAYFRMLYDWFTTDAATGLQVRQLADADLAMLHRSGFNAVHLYLWDQPTFADFYRKGTTRRLEKAGFSFPDPALSERRQWEALDEFVALAESHEIWVIPHFVHTPFNERLDSLSRAQVERRSEQIAGWAGAFISYLSPRHRNILAWGALYALEPAPDDDPAHPNPYSLLWRLLYANLKRRIHSVSSEGEVPPLFTYLYFPSRGKDISGASEVAPGVLEGYSLDAGIAKRRFQSMRRQLSYELGRETEPDLVYTYLFGPDTPAIERSLRELTGGNDAVPADRLFIAEYGISAPFGAYDQATLAFGENGSLTTDLPGQALWLRQCLCVFRAIGISKSAYWTLYDAAGLWSSSTWSMSRPEVSLNGHWGLAFEAPTRGFKPAWNALRDFHAGRPLACGDPLTSVADAQAGPVRWAKRERVAADRDPAPPAAQEEAISVQAIVSSASFHTSDWYPGSLLTLFVSGLRDIPPLWIAAGYPLPRSQFGIQVEFQEEPSRAPRTGALLAIADNQGQQQVNVQVPWELGAVRSLSISQGSTASVRAKPFYFVSGYWGDFFVDASGNTLAFHENTGAPVTPGNPARSSEVVYLYLIT